MMARRTLIPVAICAVLAGAGVAHAQTGDQLTLLVGAGERLQRHPARRARPARRRRLRSRDLSVRFTAQWLSPAGWVPLEGAATSPWQSAGSAEYTWGQAGWTFSISVPPGHQYQLRAVAELRWSGETNRSETHTTGTCTLGG